MGAWLIDVISNIVNITGNPLADTIIFALIGIVSGSIAFGFVGMLFGAIGKYDSDSMSDVHWGVRVFMFVLLTFIMVKIARLFRWLFTPPILYYFIGSIALVIAILIVFFLVRRSKKSKTQMETPKIQPIEKEQAIATEVPQRKKTVAQDICPYCGGRLVERRGPYGKFLGCLNYPECKYTRKKY